MAAQQADVPGTVGPAQVVDFNDPTYGAKFRQLRKDDGHEHDFYYYRDPWNVDGSRICFNSNRSGTIDLCVLCPDIAAGQ